MPETRPQTEFSRLREQAGLRIDELAEKLGFSARTLYRWERGEASPRRAILHVLRELAGKRHQPQNTFSEMARSELFLDILAEILLDWIRSRKQGEKDRFRKAIEALVAEELAKNHHHPLADKLAGLLGNDTETSKTK